MFVEKIVSDGISHNSYFVGDNGEGCIFDPKRDIDSYLEIADNTCSKITFVFETHRNEDYIIGSKELERLTDCKIIHGNLNFGYGETASEGNIFKIGDSWLEVLETPGHSPESLSYVLYQKGIPWAVFTGDALFYSSVGRIDLFGKDKSEEFAFVLYDSLHMRLLTLGNHVIIYPAHGPGTLCGSEIADIPISTIGYELETNPLLDLPKAKFIEMKKEESIPLPPYFAKMADENLKGPNLIDLKRIEPLNVSKFSQIINHSKMLLNHSKMLSNHSKMPSSDCIILDIRSPQSFASGHIADSYNIWLEGLVKFAGWVIGYDKDILLVSERDEDVRIAIINLMRIGYERIKGYLCGGIYDWQNKGMHLEQSGVETVDNLYEKLKEKKDVFLLDVRWIKEYKSGHIPHAVNIYIGELENRLNEIPSNRPIISICSTGNRSGLGVSILKRHGYDNVSNLLGGMIAWKEKRDL